jgi:hypothetical protein
MHAGWRRPFTDAEVRRLAADIDRQGYGALAGYVAEEELKQLRDIAETAVREARGEYALFTGLESLVGTVLAELPRSDSFRKLCGGLYELATAQSSPPVEFYSIFRCLQGASGQRNSNRFHYDSYVVTALLPVAIPQEGAQGDLVIIPRTRRIRRLYVANLIDKMLVDSSVGQLVLRSAARRRKLNTVAIRLQPGTLYFFWGYRSIHTNEPCDADKLRATALFHYGDPHRNSRARALVRGLRGMPADG